MFQDPETKPSRFVCYTCNLELAQMEHSGSAEACNYQLCVLIRKKNSNSVKTVILSFNYKDVTYS